MADEGGEPWWVVLARFGENDYVSTAVDAPTREDAEAEGQRFLVGHTGRTIDRIERVTGPFPQFVQTEERERRPGICGGCGLVRYCGNHPPTPAQTWFEAIGDDGYNQDGYECVNCGTVTWLPEDWMEVTPDAR